MSVNAYMADVTDPKVRTKRMAFMTGLWPVGFNVGKAVSGIIKTKLGFLYNFSIGLLLCLTAMVYMLIFVRDSFKARDARLARENGEDVEAKPVKKRDDLATQVRTLFDIRNLKRGFAALGRKRPHGLRTYLILIAVVFELCFLINIGDWSHRYLYLRRKLGFDINDYTRLSVIVGCIGIVTQYVMIPFLSHKVGLRDITITIIDMLTSLVNSLVMAFAVSEWMLYVGACIAFLDSSSSTMYRCIVTKLVDPDELGTILSVIGAVQAFVPIIAAPCFGLLYRNTVDVFPQTYLLVFAGLYAVVTAILLYTRHGLIKIEAETARAQKEMDLKEALLIGGGPETDIVKTKAVVQFTEEKVLRDLREEDQQRDLNRVDD